MIGRKYVYYTDKILALFYKKKRYTVYTHCQDMNTGRVQEISTYIYVYFKHIEESNNSRLPFPNEFYYRFN